MTDPRAEDREMLLGQPITANHSDEVCSGFGMRILKGEAIVQHRGEWLHHEGTCVDDYEAEWGDSPRGYTAERALRAMEIERELEGDADEGRAA